MTSFALTIDQYPNCTLSDCLIQNFYVLTLWKKVWIQLSNSKVFTDRAKDWLNFENTALYSKDSKKMHSYTDCSKWRKCCHHSSLHCMRHHCLFLCMISSMFRFDEIFLLLFGNFHLVACPLIFFYGAFFLQFFFLFRCLESCFWYACLQSCFRLVCLECCH